MNDKVECSDWIECAAKSAERTADQYGQRHAESSGAEQMIYAEIEHAFNEFAQALRLCATK